MNRRRMLRLAAGAGAALAAPPLVGRAAAQQAGPAAEPAFKLPPLGYGYDALEPHVDTATMGFHHKNHHQAYVNNLNGLVARYPELAKRPVEEMLANIASVPEAVRVPVRNNLGGHWNHAFFWELMTPGGASAPAGDLKSAIEGTFGSVEKMTEAVSQAGLARFGSGWAWLAVGADKKLAVFNTPYQDTPHMEMGARGAVIGVDVWEHAYYLKHQYRRGDYLKAWWHTVNWDKAAASFRKAVA